MRRQAGMLMVLAAFCASAAARAEARGDEPDAAAELRAVLQKPDDKKPPPKDKQPAAAAEPIRLDTRPDPSERELPLAFEMLGDQAPRRVTRVITVPVIVPIPVPGGGTTTTTRTSIAILPGTRDFKVADNGSPRPQDRIYFSFNYFDDLNADANRRFGGDARNVRLYREAFGLEKTFFDGNASIDLRLPMNTLTVDSTQPSLNGSRTDVGDLGIILRYALLRNDELDNWLTAGIAVVVPTGPDTVAGIPAASGPHSTTLQPFLGALWNRGSFYIQGFSAIDIPMDTSDVTLMYNDVGIGYFLYHAPERRIVTAFAPAFEVHVTTPLDHRGPISATTGTFASDIVDLSVVGNFELFGRGSLSAGIVTPVTGPRPFNVEAVVQLRVRF